MQDLSSHPSPARHRTDLVTPRFRTELESGLSLAEASRLRQGSSR
jgi:hypothetical protein